MTETDIDGLTGALGDVGKKLDNLADKIEAERVARVRSTVAMLVTLAVVAVFCIGALFVGYQAKATSDDIVAARDDARALSCDTDNARLADQRASFGDVSTAIKAGAAAVFVSAPDATPEQIARVAAAALAYNAAVDVAVGAAVAKVPAENSGASCQLLGR